MEKVNWFINSDLLNHAQDQPNQFTRAKWGSPARRPRCVRRFGTEKDKDMNKLKDKVAVITAATSGMALATAKLFVEEGAYVFITGRRQDKLDEAVKLIGKNVTGVQADSSNLADLDRLYATIKREKGKIDVLFASAGFGELAKLEEVTEEHFDKTFDLNVRGTLFHRSEGTAALQRQRLDFPEWIDRQHQRNSGLRRLQRQQGGRALLRSYLAVGTQRTQN